MLTLTLSCLSMNIDKLFISLGSLKLMIMLSYFSLFNVFLDSRAFVRSCAGTCHDLIFYWLIFALRLEINLSWFYVLNALFCAESWNVHRLLANSYIRWNVRRWRSWNNCILLIITFGRVLLFQVASYSTIVDQVTNFNAHDYDRGLFSKHLIKMTNI